MLRKGTGSEMRRKKTDQVHDRVGWTRWDAIIRANCFIFNSGERHLWKKLFYLQLLQKKASSLSEISVSRLSGNHSMGEQNGWSTGEQMNKKSIGTPFFALFCCSAVS